MNDILIRPATEKDMDTLLSFEQGVIFAERPFDKTLKQDPVRYYDLKWMLESPLVHLVVAEFDQQLIGSGYGRIKEAKPYLQHSHFLYLGFIFVVPEHRGKGVSHMVIEHLKQWGISQNLHEFRLEVYEQNLSAIKAYEKIGFKKIMIEMRMS